MCLFKKTPARVIGTRESAARVTKELSLKQRFRKRTAVQRNELFIGAQALRMDEASYKFLACPGFSTNHDRQTRSRDASRALDNFNH